MRFDEFDQRILQYWMPSDFDPATVSGEVAAIAEGWNGQGFVRLQFDDPTLVLTQVDHRLESGAYQEIWATGEDPAAALAAAQQAARAATAPATFLDMWQTYNGWNEYLAYAEQRYLTENTNFLVAVEAYRQAPSVPAQLELYARFIPEGAPEQVNIDSSEVAVIEARADGGGDVFDGAQQTIMQMLSGDFANFLTWYRAQPVA
ncbi:MAG: Regulator of protein signaling domain [Pseudonocardiales bacterium]|nr:Regulator of protein signaling domain [Pseudonocardiales bacterium]MDT4930178.1 Regulator of protein signaling domain [Pseudonocardiales bacterium]